jgi:subtilisin family serine protease
MRQMLALATLILAPAATAQLLPPAPALPPVIEGTVRDVGRTAGDSLDAVTRTATRTTARTLDRLRRDRLGALAADNPDAIELDDMGQPARRGEILLLGDDEADIATARAAGYPPIERMTIAELGLVVTRLRAPEDLPLARAVRRLQRLLPGREITADQILLSAGSASRDSGVAPSIVPAASQRGFARRAPLPADHGTAMADLLRHAGARRILVADVYGDDPAGGSTLAVVSALAWLVEERVRVASVSLVGRDNPLLRRAVEAARSRGVVIAAAVGNDGPAAPPAFPASYPGVMAVTGVDARNRVLIEAGRAAHLDYAAPAADMVAAGADGRLAEVRGTSYAVPLVAARIAHALQSGAAEGWMARLDAEAVDLGRRGPDGTFGRGLLCASCRRTR